MLTTTENITGLNDRIVNGLRRGLDAMQEKIDAAVRRGADPASIEAHMSDIRAAQSWLARMTHAIHLEHVAMEREVR
jgi:hypothetical protein